MRNRISSDIRPARFIFVAIGIGLLCLLILSLKQAPIDMEEIAIEGLFLLICIGLFRVFDVAKTVAFDDEFMYVTSKAGEDKIPLANVFKIKLTMTQVNSRNMWKIGYFDKEGIEKSVRILPRLGYFHFEEFKDRVRNANSNVMIKNYSHSFDLDQWIGKYRSENGIE